jgi:hypothetical protein
MKVHQKANVLVIYVTSADTFKGHSLAQAILQKAKEQGLAGASLAHGQTGFGAHGTVHDSTRVDADPTHPIRIEIVDIPERISDFVSVLDSMVFEGLAIIHDCEAIKFLAEPHSTHGGQEQ